MPVDSDYLSRSQVLCGGPGVLRIREIGTQKLSKFDLRRNSEIQSERPNPSLGRGATFAGLPWFQFKRLLISVKKINCMTANYPWPNRNFARNMICPPTQSSFIYPDLTCQETRCVSIGPQHLKQSPIRGKEFVPVPPEVAVHCPLLKAEGKFIRSREFLRRRSPSLEAQVAATWPFSESLPSSLPQFHFLHR